MYFCLSYQIIDLKAVFDFLIRTYSLLGLDWLAKQFKNKLLKSEGFSSSFAYLAFENMSQVDHLPDLLKLQSDSSVGSSLNCSDMYALIM